MCFYHYVYYENTKNRVKIWRFQLLFVPLHCGRNSFIFWRALEPEVFINLTPGALEPRSQNEFDYEDKSNSKGKRGVA